MAMSGTGALGRTGGYGSEPGTSTVVTAEIPAVPAGPNYGVLLPDGTIWYPGSQKRLPAPLVLRITVWALAFLVLVAAAGVFIIHTHPRWVDPLRHTVAATGPATSGKSTATTASTGATTPRAALASPQPAGLPADTTAYTVTGTTTYQLSVKTTALCWVQAFSLVNGVDSGAPLYSDTMQPGQTEVISASGPVDLEVAATGATVTVLSASKEIGTVAAPTQVPWHFWFEPSATS